MVQRVFSLDDSWTVQHHEAESEGEERDEERKWPILADDRDARTIWMLDHAVHTEKELLELHSTAGSMIGWSSGELPKDVAGLVSGSSPDRWMADKSQVNLLKSNVSR